MTHEELKRLEKETRKRKRIASEWASKLHDLVEDRLPGAYAEIPELAQATYEACEAWAAATETFEAAKREEDLETRTDAAS